MRTPIRPLVAIVAVVVPAVLILRTDISEPTMNACKAFGLLDRFNGRLVTIRGMVGVDSGRVFLTDHGCDNARLLVEEFDSVPLEGLSGQIAFRPVPIDLVGTVGLDDLLDWNRQWKWMWIRSPNPVKLKADSSYLALKQSIEQLKRHANGECPDCATFELSASLTGRLDHFASDLADVRPAPNAPITTREIGFGPQKSALSRLVLQHVSDVLLRQVAPHASVASEDRNTFGKLSGNAKRGHND